MSFSLGSFFGYGQSSAPAPANNQQGAQGQGGQQSHQQQQQQQQAQNNPVPATGNEQGMGAGQKSDKQSGLDLLEQLFQNDNQQADGQAPAFSIPPEKLTEAASKMDFGQSIPQEALQSLQSGDMSALPDILNSFGRQVYQVAMQHNMAVTGQYLNSRFDHENDKLRGSLRQEVIGSQLNVSDLPGPAQAMFRNIAQQAASKFPDKTAQEIESYTWEIFQGISNAFNRDAQRAEQSKPRPIDYDEYFFK